MNVKDIKSDITFEQQLPIQEPQPQPIQEKIIKMASENKKYLNPVKEILSATSLQFILSPFRTKRILIKLLNIFFISITTCLSVYLVVRNITDFFEFETTTSIKTIIERQSDFATVSFCSWNGEDSMESIDDFYFNSEDLIEDRQNHLSVYNDTYYGKCYQFNSGFNMQNKSIPLKKTFIPGWEDGFTISIIPSSDYGEFLISIHNHTYIPKTIQNREIFISPGTYNYFIVKKIYDKKLEYPYNDCLKDIFDFNLNKTLIQYMKNINLEYSQKECNRLCRNLKYIEMNCNCSLNYEDFLYHKCYKKKEPIIRNCTNSFIQTFNENGSCYEYCPLECDSFSYDISVSSNSYIKKNDSNKYKIYVYFDDLKYTLISEQPKFDFIDLVSNIGGSLGLFLGISFISFLELFEIIFEFFFIYFNFK
jgi:hypothetical protein